MLVDRYPYQIGDPFPDPHHVGVIWNMIRERDIASNFGREPDYAPFPANPASLPLQKLFVPHADRALAAGDTSARRFRTMREMETDDEGLDLRSLQKNVERVVRPFINPAVHSNGLPGSNGYSYQTTIYDSFGPFRRTRIAADLPGHAANQGDTAWLLGRPGTWTWDAGSWRREIRPADPQVAQVRAPRTSDDGFAGEDLPDRLAGVHIPQVYEAEVWNQMYSVLAQARYLLGPGYLTIEDQARDVTGRVREGISTEEGSHDPEAAFNSAVSNLRVIENSGFNGQYVETTSSTSGGGATRYGARVIVGSWERRWLITDHRPYPMDFELRLDRFSGRGGLVDNTNANDPYGPQPPPIATYPGTSTILTRRPGETAVEQPSPDTPPQYPGPNRIFSSQWGLTKLSADFARGFVYG